ncbi:hypothetical protein KAREA_10090 [Prescottella equi]|uniref:Uncharacterized protein n=1 Tax=Rhodococcus hoagii TaxID=43767 RepID=A0AAE5IUZ4_RHOHA|nr:hypothetical protein A5N68_03315 [Prescottella equi]BDC71094.1 hypothetical protein KAREA_10090 [Prescottella equi]
MTYYTVANGEVQPFRTDKFCGNHASPARVQLDMNEELWDIALWQAEIDQHYLDQGLDPP